MMKFATNSQESVKKPASLDIDRSSKSTLSMLERAARVSRTFEASLYNKMSTLGQLLNRAESLEKKLQERETRADSMTKKIAALEQLVARAETVAARLQESETLASIVDRLTARIDQLAKQSEAFAGAMERNREDLDRLTKQAAQTAHQVHLGSEIVSRLDQKFVALEQTARQQAAAGQALAQQMDASGGVAAKLEKKIVDLEQVVRQSLASSALHAESQRQQDIIKLTAKGLSSREIAGALEMPIGEVQLILSLKGEHNVAGSAGAYGVTNVKSPGHVKQPTR
jgi:chromosome segregation ATPase